jgi:hypothetical protein
MLAHINPKRGKVPGFDCACASSKAARLIAIAKSRRLTCAKQIVNAVRRRPT